MHEASFKTENLQISAGVDVEHVFYDTVDGDNRCVIEENTA